MTVKMYTTPTCHFCQDAKKFFKENDVEYEEVDVSQNEEARNEMIEKSGQFGVPVIDVDGEIIVGYDKPELKKVLKI
jgi:glutaredoxin 3